MYSHPLNFIIFHHVTATNFHRFCLYCMSQSITKQCKIAKGDFFKNKIVLCICIQTRCTLIPLNKIQSNHSPSRVSRLVDIVHLCLSQHKSGCFLGTLEKKNSIMETKEHNQQVKEKVVETFIAGLSSKAIWEALDIKQSSVQSINRKWKEYGKSANLPRHDYTI